MSRSFTRIHPKAGEHDANCNRALQVSPRKVHYRVTRPDAYPPNTPGHTDVAGREGHYTDACCAVQAARLIIARLAKAADKPNTELHEQPLDVEVWR